jgi:hypothetical protein
MLRAGPDGVLLKPVASVYDVGWRQRPCSGQDPLTKLARAETEPHKRRNLDGSGKSRSKSKGAREINQKNQFFSFANETNDLNQTKRSKNQLDFWAFRQQLATASLRVTRAHARISSSMS